MEELHPKTLEEHRQYLYEITRLKLFYVHLHLTEIAPGQETFSQVIRNRVDIYRKTDANPGPHTPAQTFFDAPAWKNMEDAAGKVFQAFSGNTDAERQRFEDEAFPVFKDSLDRRCERDWLDNSVIANYQCGSLKHELAASSDGSLWFHIGNAVRPHSFFDDPLYLPRCFRALLRVAEEKFHAPVIATHTWLNDCPKWLDEFPHVWRDHLGEYDKIANWSYGWWGQCINGRGLYAKKTGDFLREHHRFRYIPRASFIEVKTMKEHIQDILGD